LRTADFIIDQYAIPTVCGRDGITIRDIPRGWTSRYNECDHLLVQGVKIFSFKVNGDGIDPNGCQDVTIENCKLFTGPLPADAGAFKKGEQPGENALDLSPQDVTEVSG